MILRRIATSIGLLIVALTLLFVALRIIPGDPTAIRSALPGVTPEQIALERQELGVDKPIIEQYVRWVSGLVRGDLGTSYFSLKPTSSLIRSRAFPTIELAMAGVVLALVIAVPLALLAALRPHSYADRAIAFGATGGMALPAFWVGILLIALFSVRLGWLPTRGYVPPGEDLWDNLRHLVMPAVTLAIVIAAPTLRLLRASLIDALSMDYVRTAEGKGLSRARVVVKHALKNAALPTLNYFGVIVGGLLGGVLVVESVFGWPGLGFLALDSVIKRDYSVLQGTVALATITYLVVTLVVDMFSTVLDPRLREDG